MTLRELLCVRNIECGPIPFLPPDGTTCIAVATQMFGDASLHAMRSTLRDNRAVSGGGDLQLDMTVNKPVLVNTTFAHAQYGLKTPMQCHSVPCALGHSCAEMRLGGVTCVPCGVQQLGKLRRPLVGKGGDLWAPALSLWTATENAVRRVWQGKAGRGEGWGGGGHDFPAS